MAMTLAKSPSCLRPLHTPLSAPNALPLPSTKQETPIHPSEPSSNVNSSLSSPSLANQALSGLPQPLLPSADSRGGAADSSPTGPSLSIREAVSLGNTVMGESAVKLHLQEITIVGALEMN